MRGIPRTTSYSLHLPKTPSFYRVIPSVLFILFKGSGSSHLGKQRDHGLSTSLSSAPRNCSWDQIILLCSNPLFLPLGLKTRNGSLRPNINTYSRFPNL